MVRIHYYSGYFWFALLKTLLKEFAFCLMEKGKKFQYTVTVTTMFLPVKLRSLFYAVGRCMDPKASQYFLLEFHVHTEPRRDMAGFWGILHRGTLRTM